MDQIKNSIYRSICDLGDFVPLQFDFNQNFIDLFLEKHNNDFHIYNPLKPNYNRYGLSLTSLDGKIDGTDLTSLKEYNKVNNTKYNEMSFRTDTKYFQELKTGCPDFQTLDNMLGRSHIIKFSLGGFFPPHRDLLQSIRLIAFFNSDFHQSFLMQEGQRINWMPYTLYFFNTKKEHSYINFGPNADVLVLNLEITESAHDWVYDRLSAY